MPRFSRRAYLAIAGGAVITTGATLGYRSMGDDGDISDVPVLGGVVDYFASIGNTDAIASAVFDRLNDTRADHDLRLFERDDPLDTAAQRHSDDMVDRDFYAHTNPDGDGPAHRMAAEGRQCDPWEVLGGSNRTSPSAVADDVIPAWLGSPGHRDVLLEPGLTHAGVGAAINATSETLVTVKFCSIATVG